MSQNNTKGTVDAAIVELHRIRLKQFINVLKRQSRPLKDGTIANTRHNPLDKETPKVSKLDGTKG